MTETDTNSEFSADDLFLNANPSGPKSHSIRAKPSGIKRLNQYPIIVGGVVAMTALLIATLTFNGSGGHDSESKAKDDHGLVNPKGQWYADIPETPTTVPDLSAASTPVVLAPTAPKETVPVIPVNQPMQNVQPPAPDPIEEKRRQARMQAFDAGLTAPGFRGGGVGESGNVGRGNNRQALMPGGSNQQSDLLDSYVRDMRAARAGGMAGEDDQNKQDQKDQFLNNIQQAATSDYHKEGLKQPISPYEVKAGTIIPAVMIGGINSDLPGEILAQVRENVYDTRSGQHVLIPQGSRLVGRYDSHVAFGQQRILAAWSRVIFPDGSSINLRGMPGADAAGYAGLFDEVDNHYLRTFGSAILMSAITAGIQISQGGGVPGPFQSQSPSQLATTAMGQQLGQAGSHAIQKNMNVQPTLTVRNGEPFNIIVTADLILPLSE
jgi:type IV secretory pathway VirB10-like protein